MFYSSNHKRRNEIQQSNDDWIVAFFWCIKAVGCLLWLAILFPALSIPAFVSLGMTLCYGFGAGMLTAVALVAGYGIWAALDARSFGAWIAQPVRQRFLVWWRYTRNWQSVCALNGLTTRDRERDRTLTPRLRVVTGQSVNDWQKRVHELAAAWRADRLTIRHCTRRAADHDHPLRHSGSTYSAATAGGQRQREPGGRCGRDHRYPSMVASPRAR